MPRTREFDPDQALEQALGLFWSRGYAETSIEDLVETTGVSRYGLYSAFGNKRQLFQKALHRYWQFVSSELFGDLHQADASLPQVHAYLARMVTKAREEGPQGCMMCNTAVGMAEQDPEIAEEVRGLLEKNRQLLVRAFTNAVRKQELPATSDVEALATFFVATSMGLAVLLRAGFSLELLTGGLEVAAGTLPAPRLESAG